MSNEAARIADLERRILQLERLTKPYVTAANATAAVEAEASARAAADTAEATARANGDAALQAEIDGIPDADATTRGFANPTMDQTLGATGTIQTFDSVVVETGLTALLATLGTAVTNLVRAVGAALVLRSDRGAGATDDCVRIGPSTTNASMHANAVPVSFWEGLGSGIETRFAYFDKDGGFHNGRAAGYGILHGAGNGNQFVRIDTINGVQMYLSGWFAGLNPSGELYTSGYLLLNTSGAARPTASASNRGKVWYSRSASGTADTLEICLKSAANTYSWVTIATG